MMKTVGFIGVGVMGRSMVRNLLGAGYEVAVYSRTKAKLTDFLAENEVRWCDSVAECAKGRDAVITMVGYPKDVEQVYFGGEGILAAAKAGAYLIDMTTTCGPDFPGGEAARAARAGCAGFRRRHGGEKRHAFHHGRRGESGLQGVPAAV